MEKKKSIQSVHADESDRAKISANVSNESLLETTQEIDTPQGIDNF